jgi:hypothetical protein
VWLPGFSYLAGLGLMVVHSPLFIPRLCNLGVSTLTIAPFYAMVRKLYGSSEALLSAIALVALPLRVGLAASSLTEPSFLFFAMMGLLCLLISVEHDRVPGNVGIVALVAAIVFFVLAEMTRYEIWPLIPLLLGYLYARSRSIAVTALAAIGLLVFPIAWSVGNYLNSGDPFLGMSIAAHPLEGGKPMSIVGAGTYLWLLVRQQLGWLLALGAIAGLLGETYRAFYGRSERTIVTDRAAYALLVIVVWAMLLDGTMHRGPALYNRYLLFGLTLALPLAAVAFIDVAGRYRHSIAIGAVIIAASLAMPYRGLYPLRGGWTPIFVTRDKPVDIIALARWLETSPYRNDAVVLTRLDWQSSYLPLYVPQLDTHHIIVSVWVPDEATRGFVEGQHPTLLITGRQDSDEIARLDRAIGRPVEPLMHDPVYTRGAIEVYDISSLTAHPK